MSDANSKDEALPDWKAVMMIADRAIEALRLSSSKDRKEKWQSVLDEELYKKLSILQLEFMPRNLFADGSEERTYLIGTDDKKIRNLVSPEIWADLQDLEKEGHKSQLEAFERLLKNVTKYAPEFYKDWLEGFNLSRRYQSESSESSDKQKKVTQVVRDAIIIEDGEFTFFNLLWIFRFALKKDYDLETWLKPDSKYELALHFKPEPNTEGGAHAQWWGDISAVDFAHSLGLLKPKSDGKPTARWKSFIEWLQRQQCYVRAIETADKREDADSFFGKNPQDVLPPDLIEGLKPYLPILPIKNVEPLHDLSNEADGSKEFWTHALHWLHNLVGIFRSEELSCFIRKAEESSVLDSLRTLACPDEGTPLHNLLRDREGSINLRLAEGNHDALLVRLARSGYLPMEILLRQWIGDPMQLLILPLDFITGKHQTNSTKLDQIPTSLTFATIKGSLGKGIPAVFQWHKNRDSLVKGCDIKYKLKKATNWIQSYYTIMNRLNHDFTTERIWEQQKEETSLENETQFGHEVSYIIASLRKTWTRKLSDYFDLPHEMQREDCKKRPAKIGCLYFPNDEWFLKFLKAENTHETSVNEYLEIQDKKPISDSNGTLTLRQFLKQNRSSTFTVVHEAMLTSFSNSVSLIPDNRSYYSALDFLSSWSAPKKLGNFLPDNPTTFEGLMRSTWKFVFRSSLAPAASRMLFSAGDILSTKGKLGEFEKLHPELIIECNRPDLITDRVSFDHNDPRFNFTIEITQLLLTLFREHLEHANALSPALVKIESLESGDFSLEQISEIPPEVDLDTSKFRQNIIEKIKTKGLNQKLLSIDEAFTVFCDAKLAAQQVLRSHRHSQKLGGVVIDRIARQIGGYLVHRKPIGSTYSTKLHFPYFDKSSKPKQS